MGLKRPETQINMHQVNCDNATIGTRLVFNPHKRYNQTKIHRLLFNLTLDKGANVLVYGTGTISGCRMKSGVLTVSGGGIVHRLVVEGGKVIVTNRGIIEDIELRNGTSLEVYAGGKVKRIRQFGNVALNFHEGCKYSLKAKNDPIELPF